MEKQYTETYRINKSISRREVYSDKHLYLKKEKSQINHLHLHLKDLEKEKTKPKVSRS